MAEDGCMGVAAMYGAGTTEGTPGRGLSTPATAAVAATSALLLLCLLAGGLLWHRRRRRRSAEMWKRRMHARSGAALTDWEDSSSKAAVTSGSRDHVRLYVRRRI